MQWCHVNSLWRHISNTVLWHWRHISWRHNISWLWRHICIWLWRHICTWLWRHFCNVNSSGGQSKFRQRGWLRTIFEVLFEYFFPCWFNYLSYFGIRSTLVAGSKMQNFEQLRCSESRFLSLEHAVRIHPICGVTPDSHSSRYLTSNNAFVLFWRQSQL